MERIKVACPGENTAQGTSGEDRIGQSKKMNATGRPDEILSDPKTDTVPTSAFGTFFWPRPSAAVYERYKMQFSF